MPEIAEYVLADSPSKALELAQYKVGSLLRVTEISVRGHQGGGGAYTIIVSKVKIDEGDSEDA